MPDHTFGAGPDAHMNEAAGMAIPAGAMIGIKFDPGLAILVVEIDLTQWNIMVHVETKFLRNLLYEPDKLTTHMIRFSHHTVDFYDTDINAKPHGETNNVYGSCFCNVVCSRKNRIKLKRTVRPGFEQRLHNLFYNLRASFFVSFFQRAWF